MWNMKNNKLFDQKNSANGIAVKWVGKNMEETGLVKKIKNKKKFF